jgi:hypothetical protein
VLLLSHGIDELVPNVEQLVTFVEDISRVAAKILVDLLQLVRGVLGRWILS